MTGSLVFDLENLWSESLSHVTLAVTSPAQRRWLSATKPVGFSDDTVVLAAPHSFAREWLDSRCGDRLRSALSRAAGRPLRVVITVQPNPAPLDHDVIADTRGRGAEDPVEGRALPRTDSGFAEGDDFLPEAGPLTTGTTRTASFDASPSGPPRPPAHAVPHRERTTVAARVSPGEAHGDSQGDSPRRDHDHDHDHDHERDHVEPDARWTRETIREAERATFVNDPLQPTDVRPLEAPGRPPGPMARVTSASRESSEEDATQLNPKYVFDRFVIGASNRFAHAAAFAVAEAPARAYNPLFIYGGAGLGKTHLLHAIGHYVRSLYSRLRVRYLTTEQFTNEFINAIRDDQVVAFQRKYRQADVLLVDDIQFLEGKERTQEEFFHTFNALHNAEKQIVLSSDRPPKQIARLEDRLRSRFEWGLMTDVQPPDLETRIAILKKKATHENLEVPGDVLDLIASKVQSNIRELEGALIRVTAFASLQRTTVDRSLAEMVLKDLFPNESSREIGVQLIQEEVASFFELTIQDLCSPSRSRQLVIARQIAMYLVRELTELSLPRIGKAFGGRDHTTVMHATGKVAVLMQERRAIYDQVQELTSRIRARARVG